MKKNGFVLFVTLVFLYLFSLLGLYSLISATMTLQTQRDRWQKQCGNLVKNQYDYRQSVDDKHKGILCQKH